MQRTVTCVACTALAALLWLAMAWNASSADCVETGPECVVRAIHIASNGMVYIGTENTQGCQGIYRSVSQGAPSSWQPYADGLDNDARNVMAVVQQGDRLLAGTWGMGVFERSPGDVNWSPVSGKLPPDGHVQAIAVQSTERPAACAALNDPRGVYCRPFDDTDWQGMPLTRLPDTSIRAILVMRTGQVYVGLSGQGVFTFDGEEWVSVGNLPKTVTSLALDGDGVLWAGTVSGLYRWQGGDWVLEAGTESWDVAALGAGPANCQYVGLYDGRVFWREAPGSPWTLACHTGVRVWSVLTHPYRPEDLYIAAESGLYRANVTCPQPTPTPTKLCNLKIDDFETPDLNNYGGPVVYGAQPQPGATFAPGYGTSEVSIDYHLPAGSVGYYRTSLPPVEVSGYGSLSLRVKAAPPADVNDGLSIGLGSRVLRWGEWTTRGETQDWQALNVPLAAFGQPLGISQPISIQLGAGSTLREGELSLDSLRLESTMPPLVIDNFDGKDNRNALGGEHSSYTDAGGRGRLTVDVVTDTCDLSPSCLKLGFVLPEVPEEVEKPYAVWQTDLRHLDVSAYKNLFFYVKRFTQKEKCNLYLVNGIGVGERRVYIDLQRFAADTDEWTAVTIPLAEFQGLDLTDLTRIQFAFEWEKMNGVMALDHLAFIGDSLDVDDFCDADPNNSLNEGSELYFDSTCPGPGPLRSSITSGALRLDYDVTKTDVCHAGYVSGVHMDLNPYHYLQLRVRGEQGGEVATVAPEPQAGGTLPYKIKLSDYLVDGITTEWQTVRIPLAAYPLVRNWSQAGKVVVSFERQRGSTKGTLWVDDIAFRGDRAGALSPLWVDNFGDGDDRNAFGELNSVSLFRASAPRDYTGGRLNLRYTIDTGGWMSWTASVPLADVMAYDVLFVDVSGDIPTTGLKACLRDEGGAVQCQEVVAQDASSARKGFVPLSAFPGVDKSRVRSVELKVGPVHGRTQGVLQIDNLRFASRAIHLPVLKRR